jgi:molybdenum-dependent DNA-binding transcriptional regulator ModE
MYWANIYDILITNKGNILKAQRQIKLPYFEVRKAVREYEQYLKDYFKNKI